MKKILYTLTDNGQVGEVVVIFSLVNSMFSKFIYLLMVVATSD